MSTTEITPVDAPATPETGEHGWNLRRTAQRRIQQWGAAIPKSGRNIAVFVLLAAVLYVGHHAGWKMPKISALFSAAAAPDDWCAEHSVPESICVECNADLMAKPTEFGLCRLHGVAECVIDHPELAQVNGAPQLPKYDTVGALALVNRKVNNSRNSLHTRRVQFASAQSAEKAGIDIDLVQERPMLETIAANGELAFNPTRIAHLSTRVGGTVAVTFKTVGDDVTAGEILALVDAADVGKAKSQLLQSMVQVQLRQVTVDRYRGIVSQGAVSRQSLSEAEASLQEAEIGMISARQALVNLGFDVPENLEGRDPKQFNEELRFLGIPSSYLATLPVGTKTSNLLPVRAPYEGVIVKSDVVAGEVVDENDILFTIADPHQLWLILNVRQEDAQYVKRGLPVSFQADEGSSQVSGTVTWISPTIDERTRTLEVRVILDNSDHKLRDKTFGTGRIELRQEPHAVVVPRAAVQSSGDAQFVFVRDKNYLKDDSPKVFHVRQVRVGAQDERYAELLAGALPGEVVATKGSPALMAQLLRSNLGAACGCHEN